MRKPASVNREPATDQTEKPRIVIADDEQSMREWMRLLFQRDGFDVLIAEDGVKARELVATEYVDVVLTDIRMPRLDGVSLLKSIRESAPDVIVRLGIAHCPEERKIWPDMSVQEHLELGAFIRGDGDVGADMERVYEIFPVWSHRYAPGVTHNTEHVFGLVVPRDIPVTLSPREHVAFRWLPWREAADACFSFSNAEAILHLSRFL